MSTVRPNTVEKTASPRRVRGLVRILTLIAATLPAVAFAQKPLALTGTIPNPTQREGTVVAWLGHIDVSASGVVAYGTVGVAGGFDIELPDKVSGEALQTIELKKLCVSGGQDFQLSPAGVTHALVNTVAAFDMTKTPVSAILASSDDLVRRLSVDKTDVRPGDALGYYLYVSDKVTVRGTCVGADGLEVTYELGANAGWNLVAYEFEAAGDGVRGVLRTVRSFPTGMGWVSLVNYD